MNRFHELLKQLGQALNIDLDIDQHGACKLFINNQVHVQIEYDENKERLIFGTLTTEIPPGKFRENVLKEALKANYPFPRNGILAYSQRSNSLALFLYIYTFNTNGEKLAAALSQFAETGKNWKKAIEAGFFSPPPVAR